MTLECTVDYIQDRGQPVEAALAWFSGRKLSSSHSERCDRMRRFVVSMERPGSDADRAPKFLPSEDVFGAFARRLLAHAYLEQDAFQQMQSLLSGLAQGSPGAMAGISDDAGAAETSDRAQALLHQVSEAQCEQTIVRLELTRLLLAAGWAWDDVELSVWTYPEALQEAAMQHAQSEPGGLHIVGGPAAG